MFWLWLACYGRLCLACYVWLCWASAGRLLYVAICQSVFFSVVGIPCAWSILLVRSLFFLLRATAPVAFGNSTGCTKPLNCFDSFQDVHGAFVACLCDFLQPIWTLEWLFSFWLPLKIHPRKGASKKRRTHFSFEQALSRSTLGTPPACLGI